MKKDNEELEKSAFDAFSIIDQALQKREVVITSEEIGTVLSVDKGIVRVSGLDHVKSQELVKFPNNKFGIVFNLEPEEIGIVLLDRMEEIKAGSEVRRTGKVMSCPVGEELLGRVIDPAGRPLDKKEILNTAEMWPIERNAPTIMERSPVVKPLQTGILAIDAMIPIGRGQRELILGDRQSGKTSIALNTIINQKNKDIICVYCAIGQKSSSIKKIIIELEKYDAMEYSIIVVATGEDAPGLNFIAPYAATTMAEYFMEKGQDVLIVYDDLTRHAWSYRELSLLLRRPPAREAYPGDIFYIHSRLLERATHFNEKRGGGSLTALPIIETEAQNIAAYIPTNLISITDGQIYLSPTLFQESILPAIDIGKSVSRVGGKTQLPAYHAVVGNLRLSYSQFEELEVFSRFGAHLEEETKGILERGYRIREILKQMEFEVIDVPSQIAILQALISGLFDEIPLDEISNIKKMVQKNMSEQLSEIPLKIENGRELTENDKNSILEMIKKVLKKG